MKTVTPKSLKQRIDEHDARFEKLEHDFINEPKRYMSDMKKFFSEEIKMGFEAGEARIRKLSTRSSARCELALN